MPEQSKAKKVDISFTNWVLGGSLVSVTDGQGRRRMSARKVAVLEVTVILTVICHHSSPLIEHEVVTLLVISWFLY